MLGKRQSAARPLNLEEATDGTFLETFFTVQHDHIDFRLKNVNEGEVKKVWRYQAWDSYLKRSRRAQTPVAPGPAGELASAQISPRQSIRDRASRGFSSLRRTASRTLTPRREPVLATVPTPRQQRRRWAARDRPGSKVSFFTHAHALPGKKTAAQPGVC